MCPARAHIAGDYRGRQAVLRYFARPRETSDATFRTDVRGVSPTMSALWSSPAARCSIEVSVFHSDAQSQQRPQLPDARTRRGTEEIARMNAEFTGSFDPFPADALELFGVDGKVVAVVRVSERMRGA